MPLHPGHRFGGTESARFFPYMLKNEDSKGGFTGLNVEDPGIEYMPVNKVPEMCHLRLLS